jgi:hypothetical protein
MARTFPESPAGQSSVGDYPETAAASDLHSGEKAGAMTDGENTRAANRSWR